MAFLIMFGGSVALVFAVMFLALERRKNTREQRGFEVITEEDQKKE